MERLEDIAPYRLAVWEGVFPVCGDSLALGAFARVRRGERVCDLGTGSGLLLLLLCRRAQGLELSGVELDETAARNARHNLEANGCPGEIVHGDLCANTLPAGGYDLVISNPPYFPLGHGTSAGGARSEETCTLEALCAAGARLLRNGGRFALCHRPERLTDLMCTLRACGMEPKRMQLLAHGPDAQPSCVLLEGVRGGRPGLDVLPPVYTGV